MSKKGLICRQKMCFSRHQAETGYGLRAVSVTKMTRRGSAKNEARIYIFSFASCDPSLESLWNVIALLTPIFSLSRSGEKLHWLTIAGMKGTLTLSTKRLSAFSVCGPLYREPATPGERQNLEQACDLGSLPEKASAAAVETKQLRQWRKQLGGRRSLVYQNIVSTHLKGSQCAKTALPQVSELNSDLEILVVGEKKRSYLM